MLVRGDQFAAVLVERAKPVQIQRDVSPLRHCRKNVEVLSKIAQVMHDCVVCAPFFVRFRANRIAHPRQSIHSESNEVVIRPDSTSDGLPEARPVLSRYRTGSYCLYNTRITNSFFSSCSPIYP